MRIAAVGLVVILAALVAWGLIRKSDDSGGGNGASTQVVTAQELRQEAAGGRPIYWVGTEPGSRLQLTRAEAGRVLLRYLGSNGSSPPLTVGTYPFANAADSLRARGERAGGAWQKLPGGEVVYFNTGRPTSVYVAQPGSDYEVEVYDPSPKRALQLAVSGAVERVPRP
jgi:hypothetical protein